MFVDSWKKICKDSCEMIKISFTQSSFKTVSTWRIIPFSKWLITKVSFVPWLGLLLYLSKWPFYDFINGGDPKCLLSGMILHVLPVNYKLRTKNFEICRESVWEVIFLMHLFKATFYGEFHGSFYYYKPKQCTIIREIPQNHHRFILFDPPKKKGSLMTTEFHGEFSSPKNPSSSTIAAPKIWRPTRPSTNKHLNVDDVSGPWKSWDFLFGLGQSWDYINGKFQPWINMHIIPIWVFHCHVSFQGCTGFFWRNFTRRNIS